MQLPFNFVLITDSRHRFCSCFISASQFLASYCYRIPFHFRLPHTPKTSLDQYDRRAQPFVHCYCLSLLLGTLRILECLFLICPYCLSADGRVATRKVVLTISRDGDLPSTLRASFLFMDSYPFRSGQALSAFPVLEAPVETRASRCLIFQFLSKAYLLNSFDIWFSCAGADVVISR